MPQLTKAQSAGRPAAIEPRGIQGESAVANRKPQIHLHSNPVLQVIISDGIFAYERNQPIQDKERKGQGNSANDTAWPRRCAC